MRLDRVLTFRSDVSIHPKYPPICECTHLNPKNLNPFVFSANVPSLQIAGAWSALPQYLITHSLSSLGASQMNITKTINLESRQRKQTQSTRPTATQTCKLNHKTTRFGSRGFGQPTFRQTCTSVVNHEDMDRLFPFLTKWEAHIIQLNFFLVH